MIKSIDKILIFTFFLSCISVFWLIPCTSFCIVHDGHAVFGTNLDFNFKSGMIVINRRNLHKRGFSAVNNKSWVSRYGSISVNLVGIEYVWSGMNEAGLIMSSMSLPETKLPKQDNKPKLEIWMQYLLDTCSTLEEAISALKTIWIDTPDHYLVSDQFGNCAVIEFLKGELVVYKGKDLPISALTNDPYNQAVKVWKKQNYTHLSKRKQKRLDRSIIRFFDAAAAVSKYNSQTDENVISYSFDILKRVATQAIKWSIVYDAKNKTIYYKTFNNPNLCTIDLKDFNFSCQSEMKILDVFAQHQGNVSNHFISYSHEFGVEHYYNFCKNYGLELSKVDLARVTCLLETFGCTQIIDALYAEMNLLGPDNFVKQFTKKRNPSGDKDECTEARINALGYFLIQKKQLKTAVQIFSLNVHNFPQSANCYDSLGEAYRINRNYQLALQNYKKALQLSPGNKRIKNTIKELSRTISKQQ